MSSHGQDTSNRCGCGCGIVTVCAGGALQVLKVDLERGAIVVKGSVPGKAGNILEIAPAKVRRMPWACLWDG
jgi:ribosomal protein L3